MPDYFFDIQNGEANDTNSHFAQLHRKNLMEKCNDKVVTRAMNHHKYMN